MVKKLKLLTPVGRTTLDSRNTTFRSVMLTQYIWLAPSVARPIFAFVILRQNIRYTETLYEILLGVFPL
jgi:hypothetical protein